MPFPSSTSQHLSNVRCILEGTIGVNATLRKRVQSVLHFVCDTAGASSTPATVESAFSTAFRTEYLACMDYSYILTSVTIQNLDNYYQSPAVNLLSLHGSANSTPGAPMPTNISGWIYLKTNTRSRSAHGGVHMPGVPTTFVTAATNGNQLNTAGETAYGAFLAAFAAVAGITDGNGNVWANAVLSRKYSNLTPPAAINVQALTTVLNLSDARKTLGQFDRRKERETA